MKAPRSMIPRTEPTRAFKGAVVGTRSTTRTRITSVQNRCQIYFFGQRRKRGHAGLGCGQSSLFGSIKQQSHLPSVDGGAAAIFLQPLLLELRFFGVFITTTFRGGQRSRATHDLGAVAPRSAVCIKHKHWTLFVRATEPKSKQFFFQH